MKKIILLLIFINSSYAQDERFIRKEIFKRSRIKKILKKDKNYKWELNSKHYLLDLNQDGVKERVQFSRKDGTDFIVIYEDDLSKLFDAPLETWIGGGRPYKLRLINLNKSVMALLIYYYEGNLDFVRLNGSARLYMLTIENRDLKKIYLQKGPQIMDETKAINGHYHVRKYKVKVIDFNNDGQKSVGVFYGNISKIYNYIGRGKWTTI